MAAKKKSGKVGGGAGSTVAHVHEGETLIRSYSKEDHGDNFVELAKQFASKKDGRAVTTE